MDRLLKRDLRNLVLSTIACAGLITSGLYYREIKEFFEKGTQRTSITSPKNYSVSSDSLRMEDDATVYGMVRTRY